MIQIISANGRAHSRVRAPAALMDRVGTQTHCTNVHGDIGPRVDARGGVTVTMEKNAGADCVPGTAPRAEDCGDRRRARRSGSRRRLSP